MKFCPHCGVKVVDDARFCPNCGADVEKESHEEYDYVTTAEPRSSYNLDKKPLKGKVLGIVLPLFLNVVGLILCCVLGDDECRKAAIIAFIIVAVLWVIFFGVLMFTAFTFSLLPVLFA